MSSEADKIVVEGGDRDIKIYTLEGENKYNES